jgi:hypothetical protein
MQTGSVNSTIKTNIVNHLFVTTHCPKCSQPIEVSLGMIHRREEGFCPYCISPMTFYMDNDKLDPFVSAFDNLYEELNKSDLSLTLSDKPITETWEAE